ncbi:MULTISPECIES: Swt1 family HEPN domain-containing protein [Streptomyces]|uniref:Swt1 family HEPN domain-containing protein n=1 Tax=Streptomyces tendae TaxID=1932 RepID=A0ABW7RSI3_STRTE
MSTSYSPDQPQQSQSWFGPETEAALHAVVPNVMPEQSLALYARWWQLEAWLRELIYVELRALHGARWIDELRAASGRQSQDGAFSHMSTADSENPLAYLDYSQLLPIIDIHWDQLQYALLERKSWDGRQEELKRVRHRIGHIRRPHRDDLARIEQTLRDLERGAFIACASYNRRMAPRSGKFTDPVTTGWIAAEHPTAQRLIRHAEMQYGVSLDVEVSRRPWATWPNSLESVKGVLWHVDFFLRDRAVNVSALWNATRSIRSLIVHLHVSDPHHAGFTFSAADDAKAISDAVGLCFDAVLHASRRGHGAQGITDMDDRVLTEWRNRAESIDYRIMSRSGWYIVDESTIPISMFGAGGAVEILPNW